MSADRAPSVPAPALVCCLVELRVGYLQCEEPVTWTPDRAQAQVFADGGEAHAVAMRLRAPLFFTYSVPAETAAMKAQKVPARQRRRNEIVEPLREDWRSHVPNAGVL